VQVLLQKNPDFRELAHFNHEEGNKIIFTEGLVDIHSHGRDNNAALGNGMTDILRHSVNQFGLVLLMPNLMGKDALMTPSMADRYYKRVQQVFDYKAWQQSLLPKVLVTVYLNTDLTEDDVRCIAEDPKIAGVKSYPAHGTTGAEHGLRTPLEASKQLEWMEKYGVPLLVHGQVRTREDGRVMDEFDRSPYFYNEVAPELDRLYPGLPISYEHLDTGVGAQAVVERKGPTQGTFTILHLGYTRTDVMDTGVRTDMVMKPMVQHEQERPKLWEAMRVAPDRFALGSDDAWHPTTAKHAKNCACGGCYGPYRVGYYLDVFEEAGAFDLFGRLACVNAARFYDTEVPKKKVTMQKGNYVVEATLPFGDHLAQPLNAGEKRFGWYQV
jgi:dihydroorotase